MRKFYICTTGTAKGPFQLSELKYMNIHSDDLIWSDNYRESRKAIQIPEFKSYFKQKKSGTSTSSHDKSSLKQNVVLAVLLCAVLALVAYYFTAM